MTSEKANVVIIGGGLAGVEAAHFLLKKGLRVDLYEMRPQKQTPAHRSEMLAELVCSNSLKSSNENSSSGVLKGEMVGLGSLILDAAAIARVPAGMALAVERSQFSHVIEEKLLAFSSFRLIREECQNIPSLEELRGKDQYWIIASGPLTSPGLAESMNRQLGLSQESLAFYDSVAPIVDFESLETSRLFWSNRHEKGSDYLNIPLNREQYEEFIEDIRLGDKTPLHSFEDTRYFESCLPIEVLVERGPETLRFGPLKPIGLRHPETGETYYAVIQLRKENRDGTMYSMVGFQTKLKHGEQRRIFRKLPGMANAEFFRLGTIHRNTYFNSPKVLNSDLSFVSNPSVFLAGQLTGVEGYVESACMGICAGANIFRRYRSQEKFQPPLGSMIRALLDYVTLGTNGDFAPMNANFGLLPRSEKIRQIRNKIGRREKLAEISRDLLSHFELEKNDM